MNINDLTLGQLKDLSSFMVSDSEKESAHRLLGQKVIIRTYSAGVHYGELLSKNKKECALKNAIRIHYWDGAASLSQLAVDGTGKPENCRFAIPVTSIDLEWIEIIETTLKAQQSIEGTKSWEK